MDSLRLVLEQSTNELPSPSGVALAIMEIWDRDDVSLPQIVNLVEKDPALSGRLLRLANSAASGTRSVVSTRDSIARIGLKSVGKIAIAFSLVDQHREGRCENFDYPGFWSHTLLMSALAREFAEKTKIAPSGDVFSSALLSRIGYLALASVYPSDYSEIIASSEDKLDSYEQSHFGFDHNELTYELMCSYGVPKALSIPAILHEREDLDDLEPQSRPHKVALVIRTAYRIASNYMSSGSLDGLLEEGDELMRLLGVGQDEFTQMCEQGISDWGEWSSLLNLSGGGVKPFTSHLTLYYASDSAQGDSTSDKERGVGGVERDCRAILFQTEDAVDRSEAVSSLGFETCSCSSRDDFLGTAVATQPDMILINNQSDVSGSKSLCELIRSTEWGVPVYIMVASQQETRRNHAKIIEAGADAVVDSDDPDEEVIMRLAPAYRIAQRNAAWRADRRNLKQTANQLAINQRRYEKLSMTDQLTGLINRRAGMHELERLWDRRERHGASIGILMIDIDWFKSVNDTYGHDAGDELLRKVSAAWSDVVRNSETIFRSGGEEFMVLVENADTRDMLAIVDRIQTATKNLSFTWQECEISLTVSLGMAVTESGDTMNGLVKVADKMMYVAKNKGRNRVCYRENGKYRLSEKASSSSKRVPATNVS